MGLKYFFKKWISLLFSFPYQWRKIKKERNSEYLWFIFYESLFCGIAFFLGALWTTMFDLNVSLWLLRAVNFSFVLFVYVIFLAKMFRIFSDYNSLEINGKLSERLIAYVSSFYFFSFFLGALLSPENYFFIVFVFSFFASFYFYRILYKYYKKKIFSFLFSFSLFFIYIIYYFFTLNFLAQIK